jgi:ankyrin repeat protein
LEYLSHPFSESSFVGTGENHLLWGGRHVMLLNNIPWFQFLRHFKPDPLASQPLYSSSLPFTIAKTGLEMAPEYQQKLLSKLLPPVHPNNRDNDVSAAVSLVSMMNLDRFEGEGVKKLIELTDPSIYFTKDKFIEFALPFISNNVATNEGTHQFLEWVMKENQMEILKPLFQLKIPTARVICSKLLEYLASGGKGSELQSFLDAGLDKSLLSGARGGNLLTRALAAKPQRRSLIVPTEQSSKDADIVWILLEHHADVNPPESELSQQLWFNDEPPLHTAARLGLVDITQQLLKDGAQPHRRWKERTALSESGSSNQAEMTRLLVEAGVDPNNEQIGDLSLKAWARLNGFKALCKALQEDSHEGSHLSITNTIEDSHLTITNILETANQGIQRFKRYVESRENAGTKKLFVEALYRSLESGTHRPAAIVLLDYGVDANIKLFRQQKKVQHPLALAVEQGDEHMIMLLLHHGAEVSSPGVLESTIGDPSKIRMLQIFLSRKPDLDVTGQAGLKAAICWGDLASMLLLVNYGVDIQQPTSEGFSPLHLACDLGQEKLVQELVRRGANINAPPTKLHGLTVLHCATSASNVKMVKHLIDNAEDVVNFSSGFDGYTLLEVCSQRFKSTSGDGDWEWTKERMEIFKILLHSGAPINGSTVRRVFDWNSTFTEFIMAESDDELISLAIEAGADINSEGSGDGARSPIQAAAEVGNLKLVKKLVHKGAAVNSPAASVNGRTALQAACSAQLASYQLVKFLLDSGAEVNAEAGIQGGLTALQGAAIHGHIKIVLLLIDNHADINAPPAAIDGRTALEGAAEHGRLDMVQVIINAILLSGERWWETDNDAIELARTNGHFDIAELLESQTS